MIYVAAILWAYVLIILRDRFSFWSLFAAASPLIAFSAFRGTSGKDSYQYLIRFYQDLDFNLGALQEPIFEFLVFLTRFVLPNSHEFFFGAHAALIIFLFVSILKSGRASIYLYSVGAMFLIDGISNGMRIAVGYHIFITLWLRYQRVLAIGFAILSHVSLALTLPFTFLSSLNERRPLLSLAFATIAVVTFVLFVDPVLQRLMLLDDRLSSKIARYSTLTLETSFSGIADIAVIFVLMLRQRYFCRGQFAKLILNALIALFFSILLLYAVQQSLAFIRVNKILIVALCVTKAPLNNNSYRHLIIFIGMMYSANFLRQVLFGPGFLPYPGPVDAWVLR